MIYGSTSARRVESYWMLRGREVQENICRRLGAFLLSCPSCAASSWGTLSNPQRGWAYPDRRELLPSGCSLAGDVLEGELKQPAGEPARDRPHSTWRHFYRRPGAGVR